MMLILLLYPARKHLRFMRRWGPIKYWFQIHMMLGVTGPMLILFHSNFGLGSTNSNVALVSMLIVSGSGLLGRIFYTKIHDGLYGRKVELRELGEGLQSIKEHISDDEAFSNILQKYEGRLHKRRSILVLFILMPWIRFYTFLVRTRIRRMVRKSPQRKEARIYIQRYFDQMIRVYDFVIYEKLFSLWHLLHIPLFIMLIISGVVHVFAVNIY